MSPDSPRHTRAWRQPTIAAAALIIAVLTMTGCAGGEQATRRSAAGASQQPGGDAQSTADRQTWVVSLGDSYLSGEGGRWAGNQTGSTSNVDALGDNVYRDIAGGESIPNCHRSPSAPIHIGEVSSQNFACSGATSATSVDFRGDFKPGLDFYNDGGKKGQSLMLQEFAQTHEVKMVVLSIGANDLNFGFIIGKCVTSYLLPSAVGSFCKDDAYVQNWAGSNTTQVVRANITQGIINIATAMQNAGYEDDEWTLGLQYYVNVLAEPSAMRYAEAGYNRQLKGGCGFRDEDAAWFGDKLIPLFNQTLSAAAADAQAERPELRVVTLDSQDAFAGRTLCHSSADRMGDAPGIKNWKDAGAVDVSEWAMEINILNPRETYQQESMHPNYWGQLALRACWREVWNGGDVRGGTCVRADNGLNAFGEPNMRLEVGKG